MKIEIDCNNDILTINDGEGDICKFKIDDPIKVITFLEEIFNRINPNIHTSTPLNIELVKIDEDSKYTIGEW